MKAITWPAWFSGPDGKSAIFEAAEDVPKGWTSGAEKQGAKESKPAEPPKVPEPPKTPETPSTEQPKPATKKKAGRPKKAPKPAAPFNL
jgi:hypothetical protein